MIDVRNIIETIVLSVQSSGTVDVFTNNLDGTYTIETSDTGNLESNFKVILQYSDTTLNRDIVLDSVTDTSFTFSGTGITEPDAWIMALYFEVGHRIELNIKYENKAKSTNKRVQDYPLIWLYSDFERQPSEYESADFKVTLQGAIVDFSKIGLYEEQRIDEKFTPILYPILELIDSAFNNQTYKRNFVTPYGIEKEIDFITTDRPFFGSADQSRNVLPQITDAIEWQVDLHFAYDESVCSGY